MLQKNLLFLVQTTYLKKVSFTKFDQDHMIESDVSNSFSIFTEMQYIISINYKKKAITETTF